LSTCGLDNLALSEADIAGRLKHFDHQVGGKLEPVAGWLEQGEVLRQAAVLIPLVCQKNEWHVLFTRRTETLPDHKGQVAFPGGVREMGDDGYESTALRETWEELGIRPEDVRLLGRLKEIQVVTGYQITAVVGTVDWPYPLKLEQVEVARAFTIPLSWLADSAHFGTRMYNRRGIEIPVIYFDPYDNEVLWGASAQMMVNLLKALELLRK
jgi:8-oxo-dGTP pyrophosphatase MutT (NUDIX family)